MSYLGLGTSRFPNMFMIQGPNGVFSNAPPAIEIAVNAITRLIRLAEKEKLTSLEVKPEAESEWIDTCVKMADGTLFGTADSWFFGANIPGKPRRVLFYVLSEIATAELRKHLLGERGEWSRHVAAGPGTAQCVERISSQRFVHESIVAAELAGERVLACAHCGHTLSAYDGDYRTGALTHEGPVTLIPSAQDPKYYIDEDMVLRRSCCPGCHVQFSAEITRAQEPVVAEMRLKL